MEQKTGAIFRTYDPADRAACLTIFDSNTPRYFAADERALFEAFLDRLPASYGVLEADGRMVGCGGWALWREDSRAVVLRWGMVAEEQHRRGLGRELLLARLWDARQAAPEVERAILFTTDEVVGFFWRLGFQEDQRVPDYYGAGRDQVRLTARIDDVLRAAGAGDSARAC